MKSRHRMQESTPEFAALAVAVLLGSLGGVAFGQAQTPASRGGGLLPTRERPSISGGTSREEFMRRYDLDSDGRIDDGEAEMARTRMRRERNEAMRNSGIDPVTGRPRGGAPEPARTDRPADDDLLLLPGAPDDQPHQRKPTSKKDEEPAAKPPATVPPGRMPAMTGGVRAGAPAVRPGYGATGPKMDLNAGRPRETRVPSSGAAPRVGTPSAGRTLPATPSPRTPVQRQPLYPPTSTRPTSEDFGR